MDEIDQQRGRERKAESAPLIIAPPVPHAGIGQALLRSFGAEPPMPDEWNRLIHRLG